MRRIGPPRSGADLAAAGARDAVTAAVASSTRATAHAGGSRRRAAAVGAGAVGVAIADAALGRRIALVLLVAAGGLSAGRCVGVAIPTHRSRADSQSATRARLAVLVGVGRRPLQAVGARSAVGLGAAALAGGAQPGGAVGS